MKSTFTSQSTDPHFKKEEEQWADILSKGNPYAGVILITSQKLCTTTHELQKAIDANQVAANQVVFYCSQLEYRLNKMLGILNDCGADFQATRRFEEFKEHVKKSREQFTKDSNERIKKMKV